MPIGNSRQSLFVAGAWFAGLLLIAVMPLSWRGDAVQIGSKKFTESVILGEMLAHLSRDVEQDAVHSQQLGGSRLVYNALLAGDIDAYVDYTGTLIQETFADDGFSSMREVEDALRVRGVELSEPLGFNNTYAIAMLPEVAAEYQIESVSDLAAHPELVFGFGHEFLDRGDGWQQLRQHYTLPQQDVIGVDHDIAYQQLANGQIQAMDTYSTDAKITVHGLRLLTDDRNFFPRYDAVILMRSDLPEEVKGSFRRLSAEISESEMSALNRQVEEAGDSETIAAAGFLSEKLGVELVVEEQSLARRLWGHTLEHLNLVRMSLIPAILLGVPFGVFAAKRPRVGHVILIATGLIQTIPSLALLVVLIPVFSALNLTSVGGGSVTAAFALFLYSLLPIVRNTCTGMLGIAPQYREAALAIGLSPSARLFQIELPLALPTILAGISTAAVLNVGFATLGALIGAGGYGQPILTGVRLGDTQLILLGAGASALLALLVYGLCALVERRLVSPGLRR